MAQFEKGKSGNPSGRPKKGMTLTSVLEQLIEVKDVEDETIDGKQIIITRKEAIAKKLIELAVLGDIAAIKYIFDRVDGPIKASEDLSGSAEVLAAIIKQALGQ